MVTEAEEAVRRCFDAPTGAVGRLLMRRGVGVEQVLDGLDLWGVDRPALEWGVDRPALEPRRLCVRQSVSCPEGFVVTLETRYE